jgi:hypothetical protein
MQLVFCCLSYTYVKQAACIHGDVYIYISYGNTSPHLYNEHLKLHGPGTKDVNFILPCSFVQVAANFLYNNYYYEEQHLQ